jgi:hypothetical protein
MPPNDKSDFLSVALELAEIGYLVVPADSRHPIVKQWPNVATRDPAQLRKWGQKYPSAFVAIVVRADSDYWALDADVPDWLQEKWGRPLPEQRWCAAEAAASTFTSNTTLTAVRRLALCELLTSPTQIAILKTVNC